MDLALSTIAMSVYNAIAGENAGTLADVRLVLARHGMLLSADDVNAGFAALVERRLAVEEAGRVGITGKPGFVVVSRDRSDPEGWAGWQIAPHRSRQTEPLIGAR